RPFDFSTVQTKNQDRQQTENGGCCCHDLWSHSADACLSHCDLKVLPWAINDRVCVTSTRPFCTAIPNKPMSPTSEETFQVSALISSATMLPTNATGNDAKISPASSTESRA